MTLYQAHILPLYSSRLPSYLLHFHPSPLLQPAPLLPLYSTWLPSYLLHFHTSPLLFPAPLLFTPLPSFPSTPTGSPPSPLLQPAPLLPLYSNRLPSSLQSYPSQLYKNNTYDISHIFWLEKHAPLKIIKVVDRPLNKWMTDNILTLRAIRRNNLVTWWKTRITINYLL